MFASNPSQQNMQLPGYENIILELSTLISGYPPPFIYIHDSDGVEVTARVLKSLSEHLPLSSDEPDVPVVCYAYANAACCLSQRSLYESIIHTLVDFHPSWEDGCANWGSDDDLRWNENMDTLLQGLRAVHAHLRTKKGLPFEGLRFVLVVEGVERLKETIPEVLIPLTRLQELSQLDLCVIFVSSVGWEAVKPPLGASPDPYFIDVPPRRKEVIAQMLISQFPAIGEENPESDLYHPVLQMLYSQFVTVLCDVCYVFTHDPQELQYIAAARWPGFIKPVLDKHRQKAEDGGMDVDDAEPPEFEAPSEEDRLRLIRLFGSSFTAAVESLYPRITNATDWAKENEPGPDLLSKPPGEARVTVVKAGNSAVANLLGYLPRMSKFILVASFLASANPAKSDLRMFGRGTDERKKRRRVNRTVGKPKGGVSKVSQRLVGPSPFPLDRLIAILGALLEENDADSRLPSEHFTVPGEYTDMEISRLNIHSSILELVSSRLLHRTTKPDQLDGPPMFKCAISYDMTLSLAKELKVPVLDLLWEPVS